MAETLTRRRVAGRILFVILGLLLIFIQLIPLETVPPSFGGISIDSAGLADASPDTALHNPVRWITPDFLTLIALAWVARRPSFAPALAIAGLFFLADMLFQRPPGLWTALMLILAEILRGRSRSMRTLPFMLEWATVSLGIALITAVNGFTLSLVLVPQASLGLTLIQLALTVLAYPVVVFVSYALFGVSRPAPGAVDDLGHRL